MLTDTISSTNFASLFPTPHPAYHSQSKMASRRLFHVARGLCGLRAAHSNHRFNLARAYCSGKSEVSFYGYNLFVVKKTTNKLSLTDQWIQRYFKYEGFGVNYGKTFFVWICPLCFSLGTEGLHNL